MDTNNTNITVRTLIKNILSADIDNIESIHQSLMNITDSLDLAMVLLALDVSPLKSSNLLLTTNQFKNILLEQYLTNNNLNNSNNISQQKNNNTCDYNDINFDEYDEMNYNKPGAPIEEYGEESSDGFIYIDGCHSMPYEELSEEKAMKFVFLEKKLLPPKGSKGHIDQRFEYITDEGETRLCIRRFVIDHDGHVVRFLGENTKAVNTSNPLITRDEGGFETGVLADLLNVTDD